MKILVYLTCAVLLFACVHVDGAPATTARPPSAKSTQAPAGCNCRCSLHHYDPVCARNSKGERQTYSNMCQLNCYNCTHDADYRVVLRKACS